MLRATNDTNVWVSGINWEHGKPRQLLELARARAFAHVTSLEILLYYRPPVPPSKPTPWKNCWLRNFVPLGFEGVHVFAAEFKEAPFAVKLDLAGPRPHA